jgi:hypothetical protein
MLGVSPVREVGHQVGATGDNHNPEDENQYRFFAATQAHGVEL